MNKLIHFLLALLLTGAGAMAAPDDRADDKSKTAPASEKKAGEQNKPGEEKEQGNERRREDREGQRRFQRRPLTDEQIESGMQILKDIESPFLERLETLKMSDPEQFKRTFAGAWPMIDHLARVKSSDPDHYKLMAEDHRLNQKSYLLARQYAAAMKEKNEKSMRQSLEEIQQVANLHFDVRQKLRERELTALEKRLEELRMRLKERAENRKSVIDEQIKRLTVDFRDPWGGPRGEDRRDDDRRRDPANAPEKSDKPEKK